MLHLPSGAD
ncbi:MAG TPA: hypothetical protein DCZ95_05430 [Verrucomicrobia bacterium]|nr:hypothetical protein [Verrucomicrobiota bacterium]